MTNTPHVLGAPMIEKQKNVYTSISVIEQQWGLQSNLIEKNCSGYDSLDVIGKSVGADSVLLPKRSAFVKLENKKNDND